MDSYASSVCDKAEFLETYPSLSQGRVKTLYILSSEAIGRIANKKAKKTNPFLKSFCELSINGKKSEIVLQTDIKHIKLRKLIGNKSPTYKELLNKKNLIRSEILSIKTNSSYKKALTRLSTKMDIYKQTTEGSLWTYYHNNSWKPISTIRNLSDDKIQSILDQSKNDFNKFSNKYYLKENILKKYHIFSIVMLISILAVMVNVLSKNRFYSIILSLIAILLESYAIGIRVLVSGRAPITNMYETVMFSGLGAVLMGLILFRVKKDKIFMLGGLSYNVMCLFMMKFSGGLLNESISPLVPVLRDNFWLSTHVTTIILSYAAFALSWILANLALIKRKWFKLSSKEYRNYESIIYSCLKVGIILLSAGIILGGIWADYSWGRFWGWDPKETWSLIVFLFYMALLHAKSTNWINTHRFILLSAFGFLTVMMAWFGVNYILASGLHSYGFSEGGSIFLGSFVLVQISFLIMTIKVKG